MGSRGGSIYIRGEYITDIIGGGVHISKGRIYRVLRKEKPNYEYITGGPEEHAGNRIYHTPSKNAKLRDVQGILHMKLYEKGS